MVKCTYSEQSTTHKISSQTEIIPSGKKTSVEVVLLRLNFGETLKERGIESFIDEREIPNTHLLPQYRYEKKSKQRTSVVSRLFNPLISHRETETQKNFHHIVSESSFHGRNKNVIFVF